MGTLVTFLLDADIPALWRQNALGSLGGQLGFSRNISTLGRLGIDVPLRVGGMGHYALSVASFECKGWASMGHGSTQSVSRL